MPWAGAAGKQCQSMQSDQTNGLHALLFQEPSQVSCLEGCVHAARTWKQRKYDMTGVIIYQYQWSLSLRLCRIKARPLQS